jgi:hypothetical protein
MLCHLVSTRRRWTVLFLASPPSSSPAKLSKAGQQELSGGL